MTSTELKKIRNRRTGRTRKIWGWILIIIGLGSLLPLVAGILLLVSTNKKVKKWDAYEALIHPVGNTSLSYLERSLEKDRMEVISDLEEMIGNGFFVGPRGDIEAVIDTTRGMLVMCKGGQQMQPFYQKPEEDKAADENMYRYEAVHEEPKQPEPKLTSLDRIEFAMNFMDDEDTRLTLERLAGSVSRIEKRLDEAPELEKMGDIKKFRSFYLPQTLALIDKLVKRQGSAETRNKICETLKLSANAFETIEVNLITATDIDTIGDIAVLENMFRREGLLDSDFEVNA